MFPRIFLKAADIPISNTLNTRKPKATKPMIKTMERIDDPRSI
ncbi:hypothetical protein EV05_1884 [Prochlorococcus sp. MIT 0601]|nr:hypothetical protein EV05_1884 [Prochlorococcus sp. MIT 0601]